MNYLYSYAAISGVKAVKRSRRFGSMEFGICVMPKPDSCAREAQLAEALGFSHIWVADSQLMAGDVFVCLALIAVSTKRAKLGTGVVIAGTRIAPVTACALGSLNQIAPGRIVCGIGTGNSARRTMGLPPYTLRELREHIDVVRGLLTGGEIEYREGTLRRNIRFFHRGMGFVNLGDRIPVYVAANQPKAMELAGEIGDGFITSRTNTVEGWGGVWQRVSSAAARHGRDPGELYTMMLTTAALLRPGEGYDSPRIRTAAGPWTTVALHSLYEGVTSIEQAPEPLRPIFQEYKSYMDERMRGDHQYYLKLHEGHGLYVRPGEERFVTADLIRHTTMTSPPEELCERIRALERAGVRQIAFIPTHGEFDAFVREFSDKIIAEI
jgi:alkanesulfonate monooxygenase SsuD/methylene tetrahydromethanopterin reductase-like flavin-dependent oxidoreductase (luciferase family)